MANPPRSNDDVNGDDFIPNEAETAFGGGDESGVAEPVGSPQSGFDFPGTDDDVAVPVGTPRQSPSAGPDDGIDEGPAELEPPRGPKKKRSSKGLLIGGVLAVLAVGGGGFGAWQAGLLGGGAPTNKPTPTPPAPPVVAQNNPASNPDTGTETGMGTESTASANEATVAQTEPETNSTPPVTPSNPGMETPSNPAAEETTKPSPPTPPTTTVAVPAVAQVTVPTSASLSEKPEPDRIAAVKAVMSDLGKSPLKAGELQQCLELIQELKPTVTDEGLRNQLEIWQETLEIVLRRISVSVPVKVDDRASVSHLGHPLMFILAASLAANPDDFPRPNDIPPTDDLWKEQEAILLARWARDIQPEDEARLLLNAADWTLNKGYVSATQFYVSEARSRLTKSKTDDYLRKEMREDCRERIELIVDKVSQHLFNQLVDVRNESTSAKTELAELKKAQQTAKSTAMEQESLFREQLDAKLSAKEFVNKLKAQLEQDGLLAAWSKIEPFKDVKKDDLVTKAQVEATANAALKTRIDELFKNQDPKNPETLLALASRIANAETKAKLLSDVDAALIKKDDELDSADRILAEKIVAAINDADKLEQTRIATAKSDLREDIKNSLNAPRPLPKEQLGLLSGDVASAVKLMLFGWGYVPPAAPPVAVATKTAVTPDPLQAIDHFQIGYQRYFQAGKDAEREAIRELSLACELNPDNVQYAYFLGLAYYRAGEIEQAAVQTRHAAELEMQSGYSDVARRLERVQNGPRFWLERVRQSVRLAANR